MGNDKSHVANVGIYLEMSVANGSRGRPPTVKNYALPSDLGAKSLECDDYA